MGGNAERIKDLTERIESIQRELGEHATGKLLSGRPSPADVFFDDAAAREKRLRELQRELSELQGQGAGVEASPDAALEYPTFAVPDAIPPVSEPPASTDPMADPEIRRIERGYQETIAKLDEQNKLHEDLDKANEAMAQAFSRDVADAMGSIFKDAHIAEPPVEPPGASDPMTDPEIRRIERGYQETIVKLDEQNRTFASRLRSPAVLAPAALIVIVVGAISLGGVLNAPAVPNAAPSAAVTAPVSTVAAVPTTTSRTGTAAPAPAAGTIRVSGQPATYSGPCSGYRVTFVWIIEGTPQPPTFQRHTAKGGAPYGPEEGPFIIQNAGPMTWDPATGRLTLVGAGDTGSSPGFRSQITKVGGKEVTGDATSIAPPLACQ